MSTDAGVRSIGGVTTVRSYLTNCFTCKLLRQHRAEQIMSQLPEFRVKSLEAVFSSVSLDYAGPYMTKRGRSTEKSWAAIFVCNFTSAVRIELVEYMETTAFLNCLKRFLSLTGNQKKHIRCDQATTFVGAKNALSKSGSGTTITSLNEKRIEWNFSTPAASHRKSTVERQIRTFKKVCEGILSKGNNKRNLSDFELMTPIREAEYIMNCRPFGKQVGNPDNIQPL